MLCSQFLTCSRGTGRQVRHLHRQATSRQRLDSILRSSIHCRVNPSIRIMPLSLKGSTSCLLLRQSRPILRGQSQTLAPLPSMCPGNNSRRDANHSLKLGPRKPSLFASLLAMCLHFATHSRLAMLGNWEQISTFLHGEPLE